jgi:hypothetical protein
MPTRILVAAAGLAACAMLPLELSAWGGIGHHVVIRIALTRMTPEAIRLAASLLDDEDIIEASTWADRVRRDRPETYNWHFVNVPFGERSYVPSRDCRQTETGDCIVAAIVRARAGLRDRARAREARAESLKFLLHLVGDLHQPLHTIGNFDRGGNDVATFVVGYQPAAGRGHPNLHTVWDSVLIGRRGLDEAAYAALLLGRLRAEPLDEPETIDEEAWTNESHELARRFVYAYADFSAAGPPPTPVRLDPTYQRIAEPIIDRQLIRGGVRLARMLNEAAR